MTTGTWRLVSVLYPRRFRARFGSEMYQVYEDAALFGESGSRLGFWSDVLRSAVSVRMEESMKASRVIAAVLTLAGVFGVAFVLTGARGPAMFGVAAGLAALVGSVFGLAWLSSRVGKAGAERDYNGRTFRWWWVPAVALGLFEFGFAIAMLIDEPKIENVFALAVIGGFASLIFLGLKTKARRRGNWMVAVGALPMLPFFWLWPAAVTALVVVVAAVSENFRISAAAVGVLGGPPTGLAG